MPKLDSEVLSPGGRTRLLILAGVMGFLMYGMGFCIPLLKHDLGISRAVASLHSIFFAISIIGISFVIPRLIAKHSPREVMRAGWAITFVSLMAYSISRSLWITIPAMALAGIGATLFNNTNAVTLGQSSGMSTQIMLRQTGVSTLSGAVAPSIISILIQRGIPWQVTLGTLSVIGCLIALTILPPMPNRSPGLKAKGERHWDKSLLILVAFGFSAACLESGAGSWALDLMISRNVELALATLLVTAFSYGVGTSRLFLSFTKNISMNRMWGGSSTLAFVGLIIIIVTESSALTLAGLIMVALGVGPLTSIGLARAVVSPKGADEGLVANVVGAGLSIGIAPWVMGIVSDGYGFSIAYMFPVVMLFVATYFYFASFRSDKSSTT
ncbi:MAG: MFS transporter [Actinobacteria bacterium]|nr:MFS transporter [Actinomycetota bacterium]